MSEKQKAKERYFQKRIEEGKEIFGLWINDLTGRPNRLVGKDIVVFKEMQKKYREQKE